MNITRHDQGNLNDIRAYPLDETCSQRDDNGNALPEYLLNDVNLWWPDSLGTRAFLSSLTVSPGLITLTFAVESDGVVTPLAYGYLASGYQPYRSVSLQAMQPGVGGWFAIGRFPEAVTTPRSWIFSSPTQSAIIPRLAQPYPAYPVRSLGKLGVAEVLKGRVRLLAGNNLTIEEGYRYINGAYTRAIIFSLNQKLLPELLETFSGPCGKRPDSDTCDGPVIRSVSGVQPDCEGRLWIQVDESLGVLAGRLDITDDPDGTGIALQTPLEYDDVCTPAASLAIPVDDCLPELVESSSSAGETPSEPQESSSSSGSTELPGVIYEFNGAENVLDEWSLFENPTALYRPDWQRGPATFGADVRLRFVDDTLRVKLGDDAEKSISLLSNKYVASLQEVGDVFEAELDFHVDMSSVTALPPGNTTAAYFVNLELRSAELNTSAERGFRFEVSRRIVTSGNSVYDRVIVRVRASQGSGFISLGSSSVWIPRGQYMSSSSSSSQMSSSGAMIDENDLGTLQVRIELTASNGVNDTYALHIAHAGVILDRTAVVPAGTMRAAQFPAVNLYTGPFDTLPLDVVEVTLTSLDMGSNKLELQSCAEDDFASHISTLRYALKYDPTEGWSNDFGNSRALQQVSRYPSADLLVAQTLQTDGDGYIVTPQHHLLARGGSSHKFAISNCGDSGVNTSVISAAFRRVSGNPRVGIALGYQGGALHTFWAAVIDLLARTISYGVSINNTFYAAGWEAIPGITGATWSDDWHRLMILVAHSASFAVAAWIDAEESTNSSSSSMPANLTKTIVVPYDSPVYIRTGISAWSGSLGSSARTQFADGPAGMYVFGGDAQIAEFTVSPALRPIVVPNKLPWLSR